MIYSRPSLPSAELLPVPAPWSNISPLSSLAIRLHDLPPLPSSQAHWRKCFGRLTHLSLSDTDRSNAFPFVEKVLSVCGSTLKSLVTGHLLGAEPLKIENPESDFLFASLDLEKGGEVLWRELPSSNFRFLTKFHFHSDEFHLAHSADDPGLVSFILRVCESARASLRDLKLETNLPVAFLPLLDGLRKLKKLRIHFYADTFTPEKSLKRFVATCDDIFSYGKSIVGGLSSFPCMEEFDVVQLRGQSCDEFGHPDTFTYSLKKTCFGQVKRFLTLAPPPRSHGSIIIPRDQFN